MTNTITVNGSTTESAQRIDWLALAQALGPGFAARAAAHDANDSFPHEMAADAPPRRRRRPRKR